MELTKEQIQYIDNRLQDEGVRYWDIRIEMLDHIVTDVENQLKQSNRFKEAVQNAMIKLGWKENFNGGGFENIIAVRINTHNKTYRKSFFNYFKKTFQQPKTYFLLFLLFFYCYLFHANSVIMKYTLFIFFGLIITFFVVFITKYRVFKSIQLINATTWVTISISFFNLFMFVPNFFWNIETFKNPSYISIVLFFSVSQLVLGFTFFIKEYQKVNKTYQKLFS